jgi:hypothetical protein
MLREQQGGDQEAGEDEEQIDAEVTPRERPAGMKKEHAEERYAAQAIERGHVPEAGAGGQRRAQAGHDSRPVGALAWFVLGATDASMAPMTRTPSTWVAWGVIATACVAALWGIANVASVRIRTPSPPSRRYPRGTIDEGGGGLASSGRARRYTSLATSTAGTISAASPRRSAHSDPLIA